MIDAEKNIRHVKCSRVELYLYYYCPKCNEQYSFHRDDLKKHQIVWNCGCGASFRIARILSINIKLNRRKQKKLNKKIDSTMRVLVGMGYKKSEVKKLCSRYKKLSKEEIIKKVILEINNEIDK